MYFPLIEVSGEIRPLHPTPSRLKPVPQDARDCCRRTGFSREEGIGNTINFAARHPSPSRLKPVLQNAHHCCWWDRLSREEALGSTINFAAWHSMPSRLKPVLQNAHHCCWWDRLQPGRGHRQHHKFRSVTPDAFPVKAGPTGCTLLLSVGPASAGKRASATP
jgi:hypothetical protein